MATVYNKTSLKKIKKDELIQMFLDQQAKLNDVMMDIDGDGLLKEGYKTELSNSHKQQNRMVKEITKLQAQIDKDIEFMEEHNELQDDLIEVLDDKKELLEKNKKLKEENEKLKTQIDNLKGEVKFWTFKAEEFERKYIQTDENYKLHRKSADIYEEKLIEEIQILRKRYSQLETEMFDHVKNRTWPQGCGKPAEM